MGINKDRSWQEPHKILMGCPEQLPGDAGGGAVPTRTWAREPKDTGTARLAELGSLLQLPKTPKNGPWGKFFRKAEEF